MKIDDKLSDVFDIEPAQRSTGEVIELQPQPIVNQKNEKIEADYDYTRNNLYSLLQKGQDALLHALEVAKQSEHPRAFEVVGNLMKQLADVNEQLMQLHQRKQKLDTPGKDASGETKQVTNNNAIFVGSTSDLNKIIQNMTKGD